MVVEAVKQACSKGFQLSMTEHKEQRILNPRLANIHPIRTLGNCKVNIIDFLATFNNLVVLMSSQQLLCLLITQLLSKGGQQVTELGRADEPIAILRFVTQVKI